MAATQARTIRAEILDALTRKGETKISATPRWLASQIGAPVRAVREELTALALQGLVKSRTHAGGEVLYRLKDAVDIAWETSVGGGHVVAGAGLN